MGTRTTIINDQDKSIVKIALTDTSFKEFSITKSADYKLYLSRKNKPRIQSLKLQNYLITLHNKKTNETIKIKYRPFGSTISSFTKIFNTIGTLSLEEGTYQIKIDANGKSLKIPPINLFGASVAEPDDYYEIW